MAVPALRYPGVRPFETHERHLFFGRARDIADVYDLILLEKILVLFGKSGYGKSSLLKAGVVPLFTQPEAEQKRRFLPVEIRFGNHVEGRSLTPLAAVAQGLEKVLAPNPGAVFLDSFFHNNPSLWYECKRRQYPGNPAVLGQYLFIFDQFEEFFTYPADQQEAFRIQLAETLFESVPQKVRDAAENLEPARRDFLVSPFEAKVVFSIRSDRLSLLDSMKDRLPGILHKRYELRALDEKQARSAIIRPAALGDQDLRDAGLPAENSAVFTTPTFTYDADALNQILRNLSTGKGGGIEAFQLQIVCQHLERQVQKGLVADRDGDGSPDIHPDDLPDFETVYEDYYQNKLQELDPAKEKAARAVIEDGLLFVNQATGEARRLSKDPDELIQDFAETGATPELLLALEATYLLRREANTLGGFNYEISHDTLIAPITKARAARRQEEEHRRIARRKRRVIAVIAAALSVAAGASALAWWALLQRAEAVKQRQEAVRQQQEAEKQRAMADSLRVIAERESDLSDSLLLVSETQRIALQAALDAYERAERLRKMGELERLLNDADTYFRARLYNNALETLREAETLGIRDARIGQRRTAIQKAMK